MHWFKDSKNQLFQHTLDSYGCHVIYSMPCFFSSRVVPVPGFRISQMVWDYYMPSGVEHQAVRRGQMSVKGWTFGTSIVAREHLEHVSTIGKRNKKKYWSPRQSCCHHMECTAHNYEVYRLDHSGICVFNYGSVTYTVILGCSGPWSQVL